MKAGILGGGILGLYLAHKLRKMGWEVTVLEAAPHIGGLASAWQIGPYIWDRYYHVISLSDTFLRELLMELDLEKDIRWVETKTGFFTDGRLYSMSNTREFLSFPPLSLPDKLRLGFTIFLGSLIKNPSRLEKIPVARWLTRWSGKHTFEKIWLPLLKAKLGDSYMKTSAAFIWATIQRMYAARKTGEKKEMFGYVNGGYATILETFRQYLEQRGVTILTSFQVQSVTVKKPNTVEVAVSQNELLSFDRVIATYAPPLLLKTIPGMDTEEAEKLRQIPYMGVICVSLLLKRPLSPYYVTNVTTNSIPITGIIEMTALVDPAVFEGNALVYLPKYLEPDNPLFRKSDAEISDIFFHALQTVHTSLCKEDVISAQVARSRYVFALPVLKYSEILPSFSTGVPGVYMLNSAHITNSTLNVNESIRLAKQFLSQEFEK